MTGDIIRSVWTYAVDGEHQGTYTEQYARGMYETLRDMGNTSVQLIRMDHVETSFAATGRNWDVRTTVVAGPLAGPAGRSAGELAAVAADRAAVAAGEDGTQTPYRTDAAALILDLFRHAQQDGKMVRVATALDRLTTAEPHRVHRLLTSLKRGRTLDVSEALLDY